MLEGRQAYSVFRLNKLLHSLQTRLPTISTLDAHYVYFVDRTDRLTQREYERLNALLAARTAEPVQPSSIECYVVPRLGTISSWSSKATDIAHVCDLSAVRRIERGIRYRIGGRLSKQDIACITDLLYDPLTESLLKQPEEAKQLFNHHKPGLIKEIDLLTQGQAALVAVNTDYGLALSHADIDYLVEAFKKLGRNPMLTELVMFAQVNSEHCRHKLFKSNWIIDGEPQPYSLFDMIRQTYKANPKGVLSAYTDNAAVIEGSTIDDWRVDPKTDVYHTQSERVHSVIKVETHNHPTAISPFPGAATGAGGEIRDEGATGRGARPKAGLVGYAVSDLHIPGLVQPWEQNDTRPEPIASALDIMLKAPIGAASFNNEFGRPCIGGFFRSYEYDSSYGIRYGYHKPIMIAGGLGAIDDRHVKKHSIPAGAPIIVLGGPAMAIGLGGGAASSLASGERSNTLDFASVQRSNPEMQRRCQEVINRCWLLGAHNPILSIHDVGAGGLSNALPELVHDSARGGTFNLEAIPLGESGLSPMEIWCNEAQERYVLAVKPEALAIFEMIAKRERCPFAVIGQATCAVQLTVNAQAGAPAPVDIPLSVLFPKQAALVRTIKRTRSTLSAFDVQSIDINEAVTRVLQLPTVASKQFLITIGDRTVGGLITRDQMVGPWQVPVADVGVTASDYKGYRGQAMAMGERPPVALIDAKASARLAVAEAITNILAADVRTLSDIKLSANWMAAASEPTEQAALFDGVQAAALEVCTQLGLCIPVGKDSLSMRVRWQEGEKHHQVISPLSLIISAFAPVADVRQTLTPYLQTESGDTELWLIDLGAGAHRLGGSALAQVYGQLGDKAPNLDVVERLAQFFKAITALKQQGFILSYHDRSDGGLLATLCEMAFASHVGLDIQLATLGHNPIAALFAEELGAVIQIRSSQSKPVADCLAEYGLSAMSHRLGTLCDSQSIVFRYKKDIYYQEKRTALQALWAKPSYKMQALRDHPDCARQEYDAITQDRIDRLNVHLSFNINEDIAAPFITSGVKPKIAILREQGVNGHMEMAAAFSRAGFECLDVHMTDLLARRKSLGDCVGLAACGGFSYGDVLGAGRGWASAILLQPRLRDEFSAFFERTDTFALGVCNGCQMLSQLGAIIPGSAHWPRFINNESQQYEARLVNVKVMHSPSILLAGMVGSVIPIVVSHAEGRAQFASGVDQKALRDANQVALAYCDAEGKRAQAYPTNPNGSPDALAGLTSADGRVTLMMPHPERVFRTVQCAWHPSEWTEDGAWMRIFRNARVRVA